MRRHWPPRTGEGMLTSLLLALLATAPTADPAPSPTLEEQRSKARAPRLDWPGHLQLALKAAVTLPVNGLPAAAQPGVEIGYAFPAPGGRIAAVAEARWAAPRLEVQQLAFAFTPAPTTF